jgi:hypothetical protein
VDEPQEFEMGTLISGIWYKLTQLFVWLLIYIIIIIIMVLRLRGVVLIKIEKHHENMPLTITGYNIGKI